MKTVRTKKKFIKRSEAIASTLDSVTAAFSNVVSQLATLQDTATDAIAEEEAKIADAQAEISNLREVLTRTSHIKDNISNLLS